ncbi:MAG TPA: multiheme c-type cytochrome, partial [Polyangiaceae bacterium]|nr:multiheme c-type cytochrome [Polyangiaceae bacterium]
AAAGVCWWIGCSTLACRSVGERQDSELSQQKPASRGGAALTKLPPANFLGSDACAGCHTREFASWNESQHHKAMQHADGSSVLGNFDGASLSHAGRVTRFVREDRKFWVITDGPDRKTSKYQVLFTFGVDPLQQYLVPLEGGRLQALPFAWDTRAKAAGGQRWYHLHPDDAGTSDDVLHWTRPSHNWNHMCAECHSTNVVKGYDAATDSFDTTSEELGVGCEACHGGGARHVAWAQLSASDRSGDATKGLDVAFHDRKGAGWVRKPGARHAQRSVVRSDANEVETCAHCHSRRLALAQPYRHGAALLDSVTPDLLVEGLYSPDGIMQDEVFTYGSFVQSKMAARGVTCSDCHDPHSGQLVAQGASLCGQCHDLDLFDTPGHTRHPQARDQPASIGCVDCHMPARTYMGHDVRHDHGFRVPRPDLSVAFGTPNACNDCHDEQDASWAASRVEAWLGRPARSFQSYTEAFARARLADPGAAQELESIVRDGEIAAIARATALVYRARLPGGVPRALIEQAASDGSALVRRAAATVLEGIDPTTGAALARGLLADRVRGVRVEAGARLADGMRAGLDAPLGRLLEKAVSEYARSQELHADRVEAQNNLGILFTQLGDAVRADQAYRHALRIEPAYVPSYVNLADLYRSLARDEAGERLLREGLVRAPDDAELLHALGLALVRRGKPEAALEPLGRAARLAPANQQFQLVYQTARRELRQARQVRGDAGGHE